MRTIARWCLMLWVACAPAVRAHDLGVMTVTFEELEEGRYQLSYVARPGSPESQGQPILPEDCGWEQEPGLPEGLMRLVFAPDGRNLRGDDRIILPWKRSGVLVHAFWRNGEKARRFCSRTEEGIVVKIGDLRGGAGDLKEAAQRFATLGFRHLVFGLDHLFCLVGLLLIAKRRGGLSAVMFGGGLMISLTVTLWIGRAPDEGLIDTFGALTLVFLALQMVRPGETTGTERLSLLFGSVHGLGFAAALLALDLPRAELPVTGGFFLLGAFGAILAIAALFRAFAWASKIVSLPWPKPLAWFPAYVLGVIGMLWSIERGMVWFK